MSGDLSYLFDEKTNSSSISKTKNLSRSVVTIGLAIAVVLLLSLIGVISNFIFFLKPAVLIIVVSYIAFTYSEKESVLAALIASLFIFSTFQFNEKNPSLVETLQFILISVSPVILDLIIVSGLKINKENNIKENTAKVSTVSETIQFEEVQQLLPDGEKTYRTYDDTKLQSDFMNIVQTEITPVLRRFERYVSFTKSYLETRYNDERIKTFMLRMEREFNRFDETIQRLFKFARIDFEKDIRLEPFDLNKQASLAVDATQKEFPLRTIIYLPSFESEAYGDRFKVRRVLDYFIRNAIRHSSQNGKVIVSIAEESSRLVVSIRDFGSGLTENEVQILLRSFENDTSLAKNDFHLGIELYTAKQIIHRHGGKLWLKSRKGKGTVFYFSLEKV